MIDSIQISSTDFMDDTAMDSEYRSDHSAASASKTAVFIVTNIPDWQYLAANVHQGAEVVILDAAQDCLTQMADWAEGRTQYDAIHLFSHGSSGRLQLGSFSLDAAALDQRADDLTALGRTLKSDGDLLLYGCDVGAGDVGAAFVQALGQATSADIAASVDTTGATAWGGNWTLENAAPDVTHRSMEFTSFSSTLETITFVEDSAEDSNANNTNQFSRVIQGATFSFEAGSTTTKTIASYMDIQTDSDPRYQVSAGGIGTGVYALSDRNFGSGSDFSVSVAPGYTFDLTGFRTQGRETTITAVYVKNGVTSTKAFTVGADKLTSIANITELNDVTEVVLTADNYALFQDLVITDVRAAPPAAPAPTVTGVTSSSVNGLYKTGDTITVQVTFSETVTVVGTPRLTLETGTVDRVLNYSMGSGSNTLNFSYIVQSGDSSVDLNYLSTGALSLNGGSIKSTSNVDADLVLPALNSAASLAGGKALVIDGIAPAAPTGLMLTTASDTGSSSSDGITAVTTPTVTGNAEAGSTVTLLDFDRAATLGTTTADGSGKWSVTSSSLAEGAYRLTARAQDIAGNTGTTASTYNIAIDTTGPSAALNGIAMSADTGRLTNDLITSVAGQTLSGTLSVAAVAGDRVQISFDNGANWANAIVAGNGLSWSLSGVTLAPGTGTLQVRVVDLAGNVAPSGSLTQAYTLDTMAPTKPSVPVLDTASDTGASNTDRLTNLENLRITGTAEAGALVTLYDTDGTTTRGSATAGASGDWSITTSALSAGSHTLTAKAMDVAGNQSVASDGLTVTIDRTSPSVPSTPSLAPGNDTGTSATDRITAINTPTFAGSGLNEANATVEVYGNYTNSKGVNSTILIATGKSDASGAWAAKAVTTLENGTYSISARSIDAAGNSTGTSGSRLVLIDATAPVTPTVRLLASSDTGSSSSDGITGDAKPMFTGTSETSSTITLYAADGVTVLGTSFSTNDAAGTWYVVPNTALTDGTHTLTVKSSDTAGNVSQASAVTVTIDRTPPAAPAGLGLAAGSDTGTSATDGLTSLFTPTITGTAEVGSTVTLYDTDGTTALGSTLVGNTGIWSITSAALASGPHTLTAKAVDTAGNTSAASGATAVTIDSTAPAAPAAPVLSAASDSGTAGDGITSVKTPTVTGTAEAGAAVTLYGTDSTTVLGSTFADKAGTWSITSSTLVDGAHTLTTRAVDAAGNTSSASGSLAVTIDTTAPEAVPSTVKLSSDSGRSFNDFITRTAAQTISGTLNAPISAGERVQVSLDNGASWRDATAVAGLPNWTLGAVISGTNVLQVRTIDAAGNVNASILSKTYTHDTTAPAQPDMPVLATASDKGFSSSDAITSVAQPVLSGKAEPDSAVFLYGIDSAGKTTLLAGTLADAVGDWRAASARIADGTHTLVVRAEDAAGNVSVASNGLQIVVDTIAPAAPAAPLLQAASDTGTLGDGISALRTPVIQGTAESLAAVTLYDSDGTTVLGSTFADKTGTWSITSSSLADGPHTLTVKAVDAAGNTSAASGTLALTIAMQTTAPTALALAVGSDTGTSATDRLTAVATPSVTGTAEAGATVTLYDTDGATVLGSTFADKAGTWSITSSTLADGPHTLTAKAVAPGATASVASGALVVSIDATAPAAPPAPILAAASDSGTQGDGITSVKTPTVTGTAEAGAAVTLYDTDGTTVLGSTFADKAGAWSITSSTLVDGPHTLTAKAVDTAGNTSVASGALVVSIDATAPAAPPAPVLAAASDSGIQGDGITSAKTPTVTGTAEAGAAVTLYDTDGTTVLGSTFADKAGTWSITSSTLVDGPHTLTAKAVDAAGNTSVASGTLALTVASVAPNAPAALALAAGSDTGASASDGITSVTTPTVSGTAEAGATITLYDTDGTTVLGSTFADKAGTWSITSSTLVDGPHTLTAKAVDAAGNTSAASIGTMIVIDTSPVTLAISADASTLRAGQSTLVRFAFSEDPGASFALSDVLVSGGTISGLSSTGSTRTATFTPTAGVNEGTASISVAAGSFADTAGNPGAASSHLNLTIDTDIPNAPTLTSPALTKNATPILTGAAEAGTTVTVTLGGATYATTATSGIWSLDLVTATPAAGALNLDTNGSNIVVLTAKDAAGNTSPAGTQSLVIDTTVPTASLRFESESDGAIAQASGAFIIDDVEAGAAFTWTITSSGGGDVSGSGVTTAGTTRVGDIDLSGLGQGNVSLALRLIDPAGNASPSLTTTMQKLRATIDGATVSSEIVVDPSGERIAKTVITPTDANRVEDFSSAFSNLADIPLVRETIVDPLTGLSSAIVTLSVSIPAGVGIVTTGNVERQSASPSQHDLAGLIATIEARTPEGMPSRDGLTDGGLDFLAELSPQSQLLVRAIDISAPGVAPGQPVEIRVSGSALGGTGTQSTRPTALVIDTTAVSGPVTIRLDDVEFVAVIGNANLIGGNGKQVVYGDSSHQYLYLGADDDVLHGGGGNDTVASAGGNDTLFGDDGDDTVSGGIGDDTLFGGRGDDRLFGEDGDDALYGEDGNDYLDGGEGNDFVFGGSGDDTIVNSPGDDILLGGSNLTGPTGADTLVFNSRLADTLVTRDGPYTLIIGPEGQDRVTGFEHYIFTDATVITADGSPLVDDLFYLANYKDVFEAGQDADDHYAAYGWKEGRDPNALFSTADYLAANPDVKAAGLNPLDHYEQYGWKEGRDPSVHFDTELYLARNPDVKASGLNPLEHYIEYGQAEGREIYTAVGRAADLAMHPGFDAEYYLLQNGDVLRAAMTSGKDSFTYAYDHYQTYGWREGRDPNSVFDTSGYLDAYGDVKAAGIDPLTHYHQYGWKEGRDPSKGFDSSTYLVVNGDVAQAGLDPMLHYLQYGAVEGRSTFADATFGPIL